MEYGTERKDMLSAVRLHLCQLSPLPPADICKGVLQSQALIPLLEDRSVCVCVDSTAAMVWFGVGGEFSGCFGRTDPLPVGGLGPSTIQTSPWGAQ